MNFLSRLFVRTTLRSEMTLLAHLMQIQEERLDKLTEAVARQASELHRLRMGETLGFDAYVGAAEPLDARVGSTWRRPCGTELVRTTDGWTASRTIR